MPKRDHPADPASGGREPRIDPRHAPYRLAAKPSPIHRWGVIALEPIPKGRKVIEYTGERISRVETARRARDSQHLNYLFTLDNYWTIDGSAGGSGAEFINHSCDPNCASRIVRGHILYYSKRAIRAGEELTVDYRFSHDVETVVCGCGAAACRGTINLKPPPRKPRRRKSTSKSSVKR